MTGRFDRQIALFGEEGQAKISVARAAIVGVGGLGSHVVQQLALLGIRDFAVIDSEELSETNCNRYVTARFDDPVPGTLKTDIAERLIKSVDPKAVVRKIPDSLVSADAFDAIINANYVFGCLDSEGARLILNELCAAYTRCTSISPPTLCRVARRNTAAESVSRCGRSMVASCADGFWISRRRSVISPDPMHERIATRSTVSTERSSGARDLPSCR